MRLFRPEALRGQDTLHGEVSLVPPVSWQVLSGFLLVTVLAGLLFTVFAGYAKVTAVTGTVTGDKGVVRVAPVRSGTFDHVFVEEGQPVRAGDPLAHVAITTTDQTGTLQIQRAGALARQRAALADRLTNLQQSASDHVASLREQITGQQQQLRVLVDQIEQQRRLIQSAQDDLDRIQGVARQGLLTRNDLRLREEQVLTRKQALSRLQQEIEERRSAIRVAQTDIARAQAEEASAEGEIAGAGADLDRTAAGEDLLRGVLLKAPVDGTVTGVSIHAGDPAVSGSAALSLLPAHTTLDATLSVPASAAGLLELNQPVRIAIDAFPYQAYGALTGSIRSISRATVPLPGRTDGREAFIVHASLPPTIPAYGAPRALRPGMTLTARIRTHPRTLVAWLFDPILAVRKR